jgi:hypothetical protein
MAFFPTLFGHVEIRIDSRDPRQSRRRRPIVRAGR